MNKKRMQRVVRWALLIWFLMLPLFWGFDVSKGSLGYFDAFAMAPLSLFHIVVFYSLALLDVHFRKVTLLVLLLLTLYFPFVQLVNYPYLTYRDVYTHAAPVRTILEGGKLEYARDLAPESWPGSFVLHGVFSILSGLDLVNANYLLYLAMVVALTIVLYSFAKRIEEKGYRLAGYGAVLFLCLFSNSYFDFTHYARSTVEFLFLFIFIFSFIFLKGRRGYLLQLISALVVMITHPFAYIGLMIFVISYFVLSNNWQRVRQVSFAILIFVLFLGWSLFNATQETQAAIIRAITLLSAEYYAPVAETLSGSPHALPLWGLFLRGLFKYSQLVLLGVASIVMLYMVYRRFRRGEKDELLIGLTSLAPMGLVLAMGLLLFPDWGVTRIVPFVAFPGAFTSIAVIDIFMRSLEKRRLNLSVRFRLLRINLRRVKQIFFVFMLLYIMVLSAGVTILRFERNYYYGEMTHPAELSSLLFFFSHDSDSQVSIVSWHTTVYSSFFNYEGFHSIWNIWYVDLNNMEGNSSKLIQRQEANINQSQAVIRGFRDEYDFAGFEDSAGLLRTIDEDLILPDFNLVYSNAYCSIFKITSANP